MDQKNESLPKGHMKSFWPLVIVFVVAFIAGGLIYWFQFNLSSDYDTQSISFTVHRRAHGTPINTMPKVGVPVSSSTVPATKKK